MSARKAPELDKEVELSSISSRLGRTTVEAEGLFKAYGDKILFKDFTYIFLKNDRIGIIGPNGSGKSTLMKCIAGWILPDAGSVTVGQTVKMGYFSQENEAMDESLKVIDYIKEAGEYVKTPDGSISASQMLERFLFPPAVQYTVIGKLSGGEKRRLYLLRILMEAPNVLLLDEPTNDLDIRTLTILEDYLDGFEGIVITVSHDRYFLDRVTRRIFAFEGNGCVRQYEGGYTDYLAAREERELLNAPEISKEKEKKSSGDTRVREKKLKFTYAEQRDWETIEADIAKLEEELEELDRQIGEAASSYSRLSGLMAQKAETERLLEERMERWMYLEDLAQRIEEQKKS